MTIKIIIDGEINDNGELVVNLPADVPRGRVKITLEPTPESPIDNNYSDDLDEELEALLDETFANSHKGLTMGEIALADEIGILEDDKNFPDGKTYVEQIRKNQRKKW